MKLLIVTCIEEDKEKAERLFKEAGVPVFSTVPVKGHQSGFTNYLPDNWFGNKEEETSAVMFFSFTDEEKATRMLKLVKLNNNQLRDNFLMHGFIMPVSQNEP